MEGAVKVTKGRKAPEPDRPLSGSAKMPGGADKELEKLEKEAARNGGDRSKIIAYKNCSNARPSRLAYHASHKPRYSASGCDRRDHQRRDDPAQAEAVLNPTLMRLIQCP
jgi:hypothetical protein